MHAGINDGGTECRYRRCIWSEQVQPCIFRMCSLRKICTIIELDRNLWRRICPSFPVLHKLAEFFKTRITQAEYGALFDLVEKADEKQRQQIETIVRTIVGDDDPDDWGA